MRLSFVLFPLLLAVSSMSAAGESTPTQSAETDSSKAVRFTEALEADPLGSDAATMRQWLLQWLTDTPDFTVTVCDILGPIPKESVPNGPELLVQQMFGNVAYQIKHPGTSDTLSLQVAGVESVLHAYSAILAKDQKAHIPYFDNLLTQQRDGVLKEHLAPTIVKGCTEGGA